MAAPPPPSGTFPPLTASGSGSGSAGPSAPRPSVDKGKSRADTGEAGQALDPKREAEFKKRDKTLGEFMVMLDDYTPLIPDEVTDYYLQKSGFECDDPRLRNLLSLATQKFISDIATDAFHYAKLRNNITGVSAGASGGAGAAAAGGGGGGAGTGKGAAGKNDKTADKNRVVLTMDDLSLALGDHGIKNKRPDYYF